MRRPLSRGSNRILALIHLLVATRSVSAYNGGIVIIGGGPAGLAAALEARKVLGPGPKITVLERSRTIREFDAERAFLYLLDGRGQKWTDDHGLTEAMAAKGVPSGSTFNVTICKPDAPRFETSLKLIDRQRKTAYWIARDDFVSVLEDKVLEQDITVLSGTTLQGLRKDGGAPYGGRLVVEASCINDSSTILLRPDMVIGADGARSSVRKTLERWATSEAGYATAYDGSESDAQGHGNRFALTSVPSPSAGLRYKILTLPGSFPLDDMRWDTRRQAPPTADVAKPEVTYSYRSAVVDPLRSIRLGLLPRRLPTDKRTANVITRPDHALWTDKTLATRDGMRSFLEESFPQLPIAALSSAGASTGTVEDEGEDEIGRFARSRGGIFPKPTTTDGGSVYCVDPKHGESGVQQYVVLVGDALHHFPPDIGQGVNAALEDVHELGQCLQIAVSTQVIIGDGEREEKHASSSSSSSPPPLSEVGDALALYETRRAQESSALQRIVQVANPYQYAQTGLRAQLRGALWGVNFLARRRLAQLPLVGRESRSPLRIPSPHPPYAAPAASPGFKSAAGPERKHGLLLRVLQRLLRRRAEQPDLLLAPFAEPLFVLVQRGDSVPYSAALRAATTTTQVLRAAAGFAIAVVALLLSATARRR